MAKIKRVLISVFDKTGVIDYAKQLAEFNVEFLSTGGTAKILRENDLKVIDVSEYTGFPEMMNGRVKTLHPKVHGALLARRDNVDHMRQAEENGIIAIDMVVVNLYPFKKTIEKEGCTFEDAIENIDIGGPTMLRSAAKNFESVSVVIDPLDYESVLEEMKQNDGSVSAETNFKLAIKAFETTSGYDAMITEYLKMVESKK